MSQSTAQDETPVGSTLLVAVDLMDDGDLLEHATAVAKGLDCGLTLVHVAAPEPDFVGYEGDPGDRLEAADVLRGEHHALRDLADATARESGLDVAHLLLRGATVEAILEYAKRHPPRLLVVGRHRRNAVQALLLGSVSSGLLASASCPVLVLPRGAR